MFSLFDIKGKKEAAPLPFLAIDNPTKFQIYDNYRPALADGEYTVTITPTLRLSDDTSKPQLEKAKKIFEIQGPRFCLEQTDIHGFFPPPNSSGKFSTCLPHVLFNKVALPWERDLQITSGFRSPWLALLCLDQEEYSKCELSSMKVGEWIKKAYSDEIHYPELTGISDKEKELNCQFLKIDKEIFFNIRPNLCELSYLSHVRQVETKNREDFDTQDRGVFSILFGNRFPQTGSGCGINHKVFLISLEGLVEYFKEDKRANISQKYISVITLTNWSFICLEEPKENFSNLVKAILEEQGSNTKFLTLPQLPDNTENPADNEQAKKLNPLFDKGYVPLEHCLRTAETTFSWYHGPLITSPMLLDDVSKESILKQNGRYSYIYYEEQSVFDVSYVTAWELGRLLAISDANFVDNLIQLRVEHRKQTQNLAMMYILQSKLSGSINQPNVTALIDKAEAGKKELSRLFAGKIEGLFSYELYLMADFPVSGIPAKNKIYLKKENDNQLSYIIGHEEGNKATSFLDINVEGELTEEVLKIQKENILKLISQRGHISVKFNELLEKISASQQPRKQLKTTSRLSQPDEDPLQKSYRRKVELIKEQRDKEVLREDNLKNLAEWLRARRLLKNIPFQYLVVDQKLLPNNSIRFFYIDPIWIQKMEEGFFSIGLHQKEDTVNDKIKLAIQKILDQKNKVTFGFLLRSSLVSGWPGLIIETTNGVTTLRQERLSDNVLICLFDKVPGEIFIKEPEEHICFGVEGEHIDYAKIQLRCVTNGNSQKIGEKNGIELDVANYFRQNSPNLRVLSIEDEDVANQSSSALLIPAFKEKLKREQISAGEFSLQLIKTPQECKLSLKLKNTVS